MKKLMNKRTGRAFLFALTLIPIAAIGGYFSVRLLLSSLDPSMLEDAISKAGSEEIVLAVSVIMTVVYATFDFSMFPYERSVWTHFRKNI